MVAGNYRNGNLTILMKFYFWKSILSLFTQLQFVKGSMKVVFFLSQKIYPTKRLISNNNCDCVYVCQQGKDIFGMYYSLDNLLYTDTQTFVS